MSSLSAPALILCERSGRWATSLRRHGLVERLRLVETRSLVELEEELESIGSALVGLEFSEATAERMLQWLGRRPGCLRGNAVVIFADRALRTYELLLREAGAAHFVASELELLRLGPLFDRYLSQASFGKLDDDASITDRVRAGLPWSQARRKDYSKDARPN